MGLFSRAATTAVVLLAVGACADAGPPPQTRAEATLPPPSQRVPTTFRAVGAIGLDHLPEGAQASAAWLRPRDVRSGTVEVELSYPGTDGEDHRDLVWVRLSTGRPEQTGCPPDTCAELPDLDGAAVALVWSEGDPEQEPGYYYVRVQREREHALVGYSSGQVITGDPREMDLRIPLEALVDLATDARLRLRTSPEAVDAGDALSAWGGGEPPTPRSEWVPQTGEGLVLQFLSGLQRPDHWHGFEPSPYADEFGPGTIAGRVKSASPGDTGAETVDILVSPRPPEWLTGNSCRGTTYTGRCTVRQARAVGRYLVLWSAPPGGDGAEVWTVQVRDTETVAARFTGDTGLRLPPGHPGELYDSGIDFLPSPEWGLLADPLVFLYDVPD